MGPTKEQAWSNLWVLKRPTLKAVVVVMAPTLQVKSKDHAATTTTVASSNNTKANSSQTRSNHLDNLSSCSLVKIQIKILINYKQVKDNISLLPATLYRSSSNFRCNSRITSVSAKNQSRVWVISSLTKLAKMSTSTQLEVPVVTLKCLEVKTSRCILMSYFREHLPSVSLGCHLRSHIFPIRCSTPCRRIKPTLVSDKITQVRCSSNRSHNLALIKMLRTNIKSKESWGLLRVVNLNRLLCHL